MTAARGSLDDLSRLLHRIDRRGYGAYREIKGCWAGTGIELRIEHVQGDPFATPSRLSLRLAPETHRIPEEIWSTPPRKTAACDFLLRVFAAEVRRLPRVEGMGHSGRIMVDAGGAEILSRSGCDLTSRGLELRFRVGLPARGRSILGRAAAELLADAIPRATSALTWGRLAGDDLREWALLCEDHVHLQTLLAERGLVAFLRRGSLLPRASGVSSAPLVDGIPFEPAPQLEVTLPTLHHGVVTGMGIPEGVTLITGGGFHGKTTVLEAIQLGVYPHVPGDGREWVVTRPDVVKVRSEDGRSVAGVDLSAFIHDLPGSPETAAFTTADASGSTSLAAAIVEALEVGAGAILLDEDTSATNLLIRDARMQTLVRKETITPLIDRVRDLHGTLGVSTLLVVGGSGDYLEVADRVVLMEDYRPRDVSDEARRVATEHPTGRSLGDPVHPLRVTPRRPLSRSFDARRGRREKVKARGLRELVYGENVVDLSALEQMVDDSQARAIGVLLRRLGEITRGSITLRDALDTVLDDVARRGLAALDPSPELALPRRFELAGAVNRLRGLVVEPA
jgi:predicted ABC-class ATPase